MTTTLPGFSADRALYGPHGSYQQLTHLTTRIEPTFRLAQEEVGPCSSPTSPACRQCWSACIRSCSEPNPRYCFNDCREQCGGQPRDPGPVGGGSGPPTTPANTWTSTDCIGYRQVQVCGVPYPTLSDCIATCSSGICTPTPGGYGCCSTREVCIGTTSCTHYDGYCTGSILTGASTRCVASPSGFTRCAGGPNQFPWVVECSDGSRSSGVGFCLW
jgi:hypothetical protein